MSDETIEHEETGADKSFDTMPSFVTFEDGVPQRVHFAYNGKVRKFTRSGPSGKFTNDHILVKVNGQDAWMSIGSTRLITALKALGKFTGEIDITAIGDGTARTWTVKKAKA